MLLKKLTEANGLANCEDEVRNLIIEEIKDYVDDYYIDRMGNIIASKNSNKEGKHIGLSAHMDEVGMMVKGITPDGMIKFITVGGLDPRVLVAKRVNIGKSKIPGIIGSKPIHLLTPAERNKALTLEELYIDIGAKNKEDAEKHINIGDEIYFDSELIEFGEDKIKAKAFDDRVGCALIIDILKSNIPYKITATFVTQEEAGLRGSAVAANNIDVDLILNLEGTISADLLDVKDKDRVTVLGNGPAISLIDRTSVYLKPYVESLVEVAKKNDIKYQFRGSGAGGTDAGRYHTSKEGTIVLGISVPCRYIHSPISVIDKKDYESTKNLVLKYIEAFNEEEIINE